MMATGGRGRQIDELLAAEPSRPGDAVEGGVGAAEGASEEAAGPVVDRSSCNAGFGISFAAFKSNAAMDCRTSGDESS